MIAASRPSFRDFTFIMFSFFKVFDMEEFKSHIGIQLRSGQFDEQRLQLLSTVCISFCHDTDDPLLTPCWLCIINLMALDMIGDPDGQSPLTILFQYN